MAISSPKHLSCPWRLLPCYCHLKKGDQSRRRVPEIADQGLASSLYICELLVFQLPLYVANPLYYNSTYACFPFLTSERSKASLTRQGIADKYTFTRPVLVSLSSILNTLSLASRPSSGPRPLRGLMGWKLGIYSRLWWKDADLALVSNLIFVVITEILFCRWPNCMAIWWSRRLRKRHWK